MICNNYNLKNQIIKIRNNLKKKNHNYNNKLIKIKMLTLRMKANLNKFKFQKYQI